MSARTTIYLEDDVKAHLTSSGLNLSKFLNDAYRIKFMGESSPECPICGLKGVNLEISIREGFKVCRNCWLTQADACVALSKKKPI